MSVTNVTDTSVITAAGPLLDVAPFTDVRRLLGQPDSGAARHSGPTTPSLYLYDPSIGAKDPHDREAHAAMARTFAPGARVEQVRSWDEVRATLSPYARIGRLVLYTHGGSGRLVLGGEERMPAEARDLLAASRTYVSQQVHFLGCEIMDDPYSAATIAAGVAEPHAVITGYTWKTSLDHEFFQPGADRDVISRYLEQYRSYLLRTVPSVEQLHANGGSVVTLWWREVRDNQPPPGDGLDENLYVPLSGLREEQVVRTREQAQDLAADGRHAASPRRVRITDVTAVAEVQVRR